ncbi:MAG: bifunctional DNA-formamidopyrimidine glycosylase/DNA-(apurinic or apyrimidinic site) lyase [Actinomycetota bacterium]|jgi:formamidopyrimidine-DNA glycosylase
MPELPEVETVRRGLARHLPGKRISRLEVVHRGGNRQSSELPLPSVKGATIIDIQRRGKFLWFVLDRDYALVGHLGMSGQMLITPRDRPDEKHLRIRIDYGDQKREFRFIDQRTFGWMAIDSLVKVGRKKLPQSFLRIAPDIFDSEFDRASVIARMSRSKSEIKRVLLDQGIVSGIGNIYADEALWLSKIHPERRADALREEEIRSILRSVRYVMTRALARGGTSIDDLYINVNGESGYFAISLNAYGREDEPCRRCRTLIRRIAFANRSTHYCPQCQPRVPTRTPGKTTGKTSGKTKGRKGGK